MACKKPLILISLLLLFYSCKKEIQSTHLNGTVPESDSIQIWIKNGKNTNLPLKTRKEFLQKAYNNTTSEFNDSLRLSYCAKLSLAYLKLPDSINFRNVNKSARILSEKRKDSTIMAELHWDLAVFYTNHFMKDSAYYQYGQAAKIYYHLNDSF
ncbi:MAG: hypothetical protein WBN55_06995, partial [Eudoraea sp.]|uniref:hypothetical protein n=1 Tax=Eudoraea sp. TaxID=1979955 RepID=UPI003C738CC2